LFRAVAAARPSADEPNRARFAHRMDETPMPRPIPDGRLAPRDDGTPPDAVARSEGPAASARDEAHLLHLVEHVYASSANGDWASSLSRLTTAWGATVGMAHAGEILIRAEGLHPDLVDDYARRYRLLDERRRLMLDRTGEVLTNARLALADGEFAESEFYRGFAARAGAFYVLGFGFEHEGAPHALCLHRPRPAGEFDDAEVAAMERLRPHVVRAAQLARELRLAREALADATTALDRLPCAFVLVDAGGRPRLASRAARRILDRRDGLSLAADGLRAATPTLTARLWDLIARAGAPAPRHASRSGGFLRLPRPSGAPPLSVLAAPASPPGQNPSSSRASVIVFLRDPSCEPQPAAARLEQLYGLTPAEARLAERLAAGEPLDAAAAALDVSRETVRSQLRAVFDKTDTRRQGELLRKLALDSVLLPGVDEPGQ